MSDNEIEMWATLAIWFIGACFVGSTIGWYLFLRLFKMIDDYLQDRAFKNKGFTKYTDDKGNEWYVGYNDTDT